MGIFSFFSSFFFLKEEDKEEEEKDVQFESLKGRMEFLVHNLGGGKNETPSPFSPASSEGRKL